MPEESRGSRGVQRKLSCSNCNRKYGMEWAMKNHQKLCQEKEKAIENHPERYSRINL